MERPGSMGVNVKDQEKGFTLIELLVVIAIIALLLSIIMPALQKTKEQARTLMCSSNNRTLMQAYTIYLVEYDNKFLPYYDQQNVGYTNLWMNSISEIIDDINANRFCPNAPESKAPEMTYYPTESLRGTSKIPWRWWIEQINSISYGSYGINGWLYGPDDPYGAPYPDMDYVTIDDMKNASRIPVFADCVWVDGWPQDTDDFQNAILTDPLIFEEGYFQHGMNQNMGRFFIDRHGMKITISFFDGHAKPVRLEKLWTFAWHKNFEIRDDIEMP